jgi:hypothetical protein
MKKALSIIAAVLCFCCPTKAQNHSWTKNITAGMEWNYSAQLYKEYNFSYITSIGDREREEGNSYEYRNNGQLFADIGYNILKHFNLSIYAGYAGYGKENREFPISLRCTYIMSKPHMNSCFVYGDGGWSFGDRESKVASNIFKCGGGYRYYLGAGTNLDFILGVQLANTHPDIYDIDTKTKVTGDKFGASDALQVSINAGMAINF